MKKLPLFLCAIGLFFLCTSEDGCNQKVPQKSNVTDAVPVNVRISVPKNSNGNTVEQQNILDKYKVTTDPTKILWINIYAMDGHIILRNPVRCKVTSSGKRLEPLTASTYGGNDITGRLPSVGDNTGIYTNELMQADGTFGSSDAYIYWFDPMGRYHQKGDGYLITDYPIDLDNPVNKITGLYNVNEAALAWQHAQEAELRKQQSTNKN